MNKKRKIKRIFIQKKKEINFNFSFDDEAEISTQKQTIRKILILSVLTISFLITQYGVFSPTQKLVDGFVADYESKENLITTGKAIKIGIQKKTLELEKDYKILKESFFDLDKSHEFFTLIANTAMVNQLKILSINKVGEEAYKTVKIGQDPATKPKDLIYDVYPKYVQSNFNVNFEGDYINYLNFINDIKKENKGLLTESSIIKKNEQNTLIIESSLAINFTKSDD
ncbi:hypothetical protein N8Z07_03335 [Pelagibacteraceae bacterium]|nr:hypothetical protein [Pelagibacteraceae bacterium]